MSPVEVLAMSAPIDEDRLRAEREAMRKWEEAEARKKADELERMRRDEEDRRRAEVEAKSKADAETRVKAIDDAKRRYEESHRALLQMLEQSATASRSAHVPVIEEALEVDDPIKREQKERLMKDVYMTDVGNPWVAGDPGIEHLFSEDGVDSKGRAVVAVNALRVPFRRKDNAFNYLRYQLYPTVSQGKYILVIYGSCSSTAVDKKMRVAGALWSIHAMMRLPKIFKQNAKHIVLVRPGGVLKALLHIIKPFHGVSDGGADFFRKLHIVDRAEDIAEVTNGEVKLEDTGSFRKFYNFVRDI